MKKFNLRNPIAIGLIALGVILLVIPIPQMNFLGVSKCGRVISEIDSREQFVLDFLASGYDDVEIYEDSVGYEKIGLIKVNLDELWKIGTNNPKCFSNSQRIYIEQIKSSDFLDSVLRETGWGFKSSRGSYVRVDLGSYAKIKDN